MTSDSPLRYLNEGTDRQRVTTQPVDRWAQAPLSPDAHDHLPAHDGHQWVLFIEHPARESAFSSSKLGFATAV